MLTIQKLPLCAKGAPVAITLENSNYMRVTLLSYGATLQSIVVPDQNGALTDVLLGYESVKEYEENSGYLGACIGRNGNRIANAAFTLNGQRFQLTANEGKNQLHGGLCGFDKNSGTMPAAKIAWNSQRFWLMVRRATPADSTCLSPSR